MLIDSLPVLGQRPTAQSISTIAASDDPLYLRSLSNKTDFGLTIASSGDNTIIAAPGSDLRIVVTMMRIQNHSTTATTALIKKGAGDANPTRVRCPVDGSGVESVFERGNEYRLPTNTAFIINLSTASSFGVSVRYYIENAQGIPV